MLIVDEDFKEFSENCKKRELRENSDKKLVCLCGSKEWTGFKHSTCCEEDCPRLSGL